MITPEEIRLKQTEQDLKKQSAKVEDTLASLTEKQRSLVVSLLMDPSQPFEQAGRNAGYKCGKNSRLSEIKRNIDGKLGPLFFELGVTAVDIVRVIHNCLNAENHTPKIKKYYEKGKVVREELEIVSTPDLRLQLQAAKLMCTLGNFFPAQKHKVEHELKDSFTPKTTDQLKRREQHLNEIEAEFEIANPN